MRKKVPLFLLGIGIGLSFLISMISSFLYDRIYYFDGPIIIIPTLKQYTVKALQSEDRRALLIGYRITS